MSIPVSDLLNFFGRETYADELLSTFSDGKPLALFGLRKIGKSSLLRYLQDKAEFPVAYVDLQTSRQLPSLLTYILKSWERDLHLKRSNFDWKSPELKSDPTSEFVAVTQELMMKLESNGYSPRLGIFIDEIELITPKMQANSEDYDPTSLNRYLTFSRTLRGLIQEAKAIALIIVGVDPRIIRTSRLGGEQNPFYQFFREEYLGPISREDCIQMIRNIGCQMDLDYDPPAIEHIVDASGRHPFIARKLCSIIVKDLWKEENDGTGSMASNSVKKITYNMAKSFAERFIRDPETACYLDEQGLWGDITNLRFWDLPQVRENISILTTLAKVDYQSEPAILMSYTDNKRAREKSVFELKKRYVLSKDTASEILMIQMRLFQNWIESYQL